MNLSKDRNAALSEAYDKYADKLYRIALSQLQNREDADDAVQDVFIKYFSIPIGFSDDEHEQAWLIRVTVNRCHDILRRKKIRTHITLDDISELIPDESSSDANIALDVMKSLEMIPEKLRVVIVLHDLEGFKINEIANSLGISQSGVKMRLLRGREKLKSILEKEGGYV